MDSYEYLSSYKNIDKEISSLYEEASRLRSLRLKAGGSIVDASSKTNNENNSLVNLTDKIIEVEKQINAKIGELLSLRSGVIMAIDSVNNPTYKLLLRYRYINGYTFERIAEKMNYSWRHIIRMHEEALLLVKVS